jgi:hypothetical protein
MNPNIRANEIVATFQRYLSTNDTSETDNFSLKELRSADEQLGQRDVGANFRIAIKNRISELELNETRKHESKIRAWNLLTGILIGVVVMGLGAWLFKP